ncbi:MAG: Threonine-tRNA ligase [Candidatus Nomurabacteria bacterium GW2011_GWE1_32_28]|uniref:Threonine--tRNA ligase n=1 Tax=Candidatus Nomurabacteria bacterium GW2011_GWF1_31_48 TaxID=1618767 RepID=A0A0F9YUP2_9BACT|nr:MAG: Threonine-tRNA ligase [Candidatus Nomurabacteria bacterium GW2011_GWF2_30_133]KKP28625.1 MAG: Threonine-tRNA ligase [Candidatus Nomurabacteria bacterium GW2011_GWE2_31_40]KKP30201.1 MAG: Threonine-tRNA ligase [Candidatus Nomurabacteria bacterium GW2011_GWF1_31_48]KKP34727.1 MAG: Threonine-tRNA ligase [Candidatus Nomurabacteria bacterium GW2011_GWE1_32_28]HAS80815.1 threonine--tRNA ligase [Candidatus Nomurabacteria bacterium]
MENNKLHNLRHSLAHLLSAAVLEMYPDTKNTIGPSIEDGFYYDFEFSSPVSEKDLPKIEKKMRDILKSWKEFKGEEKNLEQAKEYFSENQYKIELIEEIDEKGEKITFYTCGNFTDLCRGGHLENPSKEISPDSFKLDRVAGAYWRGDEKNKMLTRIYGLAFETKEELETYINQREEAKKRDHKKLGKELKLFTISELVGKGLPMLLPKGNIIKTELEKFIRAKKENLEYSFVTIPHIAKKELYIKSGHMGKYDAMMPTMTDENGDEFVMKAMNCPHHFEIYNSEPHTYKDLPLRIAENTTVYRNEKSGELAGLLRVKNITQDDTHHFVTQNQIRTEIEMIFNLMREIYEVFNFNDYKVEISVRDYSNKEKYFGSDEIWEKAENILIESAKKLNLKYTIEEGEAAFYGPKIDIKVKDSIGREWQLTTIQLDFNQPENFEMDYIGDDGKKHRVVVLHVAILGSFERFMGVLIEHYAGSFPLWLSPVQVSIIPVKENHEEEAKKLSKILKEFSIRTEIFPADNSLGKRIHLAKDMKTPYVIILGDKEASSSTLTIENRDGTKTEGISTKDFLEKLTQEIKDKK